MQREGDRERARDQVLHRLKTDGPRTAAQLAEALAVTAVAVRQHLAALEAEGLVEAVDEQGRVGRPARVWGLTSRSAARFPDAHAELTVDLIGAMRETFGEDGLDRLIRARSERQLEAYRARLPGPGTALAKRVEALAAARREEGYMAGCVAEPDGSFLLVENHCPICAAARVCQGLCRDELSIFRAVLGPDVEVERCEHLLAGARRCAYRIAPR